MVSYRISMGLTGNLFYLEFFMKITVKLVCIDLNRFEMILYRIFMNAPWMEYYVGALKLSLLKHL